ncbi:MAG: lipoyl(octanoyl) transferase LipB [Candidatus Symbiothrix sp.]|jgi:lipoyl(octanoyl) transferase|nr:lipoyl(octanoyl) transferase LipB [Candidatus Symbiothrix sp.]
MELTYIDWGIIPYAQAYGQQNELFEAAIQNKAEHKTVENKVIFCEHPHVITIGKHGLYSNLLFPEKTLKEKDVELYQTDRGGDITYHGPGQVVGYPIFDLEAFAIGLKEYIRRMEEVIIQTIAGYGIKGDRLEGATGVWLDKDQPGKARKIAAIGVRSSRYVTMHGFALNVNTDLSYFKLINPCGFVDKGVTSLQQELGHTVDTEALKATLCTYFRQMF